MGLLNFLRKTGIFRFGTKKAKYTNGINRPIEFQMDNVYNEDKDILFKKNK